MGKERMIALKRVFADVGGGSDGEFIFCTAWHPDVDALG
jgi:hypothetical protein